MLVVRDAHEVVTAYWAAANERDWDAFGDLLSDDVVYEGPQTRERVRGRANYVRFNVEGFPGDWHLVVNRIIGEGCMRRAGSSSRTLMGSFSRGCASSSFKRTARSCASPTSGQIHTISPQKELIWSRGTESLTPPSGAQLSIAGEHTGEPAGPMRRFIGGLPIG